MDIPEMDIARPAEHRLSQRRRRIFILIAAAAAIALVTLGVSRVKPAAPVVDRSLVVIDAVKRGPLLRQVRGTGSLVPIDVNWIAAATDARVSRVVVQPGTAVHPDTLILELSDPEQVQRTDDARLVLKGGEADLLSLRNRLRSDELNAQAEAARLQAEYEQARLRAAADQEMADKGVLPDITRRLSRNAADELERRTKFESERLRVNAIAMSSQLAAQEAKVEQLRAQSRLQEQKLASLEVRAGIEGVLQQVSVEVGQRVAPGTSLAKVIRAANLKAQLRIPETQARDIALGEPAAVDTRNGIVAGHVIRIDPAAQNATVTVDVGLDGPLPRGARPDLTVDGTIELERLTNVLYVARPVRAQEQESGTVFRLDAGGATQVKVRFGRGSVTQIEIVDGLREGDRIITSDTSAWDGFQRIRLE
jgi:HlyD family secretion protein